ncbi:FecR family protein [Arsenicibacter rosenii]|uniref:Iron dicitrate transport regulator FecR n=1 Tax=Arsenicibacter rosenii TaxID=1750698 RepID=A0A1S2VR01_9BACT|nr:FecR domain-containing protein [Arsenicibacter rosenii]OIN60596.1 hypothetical protein BLX24_00255 [Arsenicibacter rosenii]
MLRSRAEYLVNRLIENQLTSSELDELLRSMGNERALDDFSDVLEAYFNSLVEESETTDLPRQEPPATDSVPSGSQRPALFGISRGSYTRMAALLALALGFLGILYLIPYRAQQQKLSDSGKQTPLAAHHEEVVPRGSRKSLRLADGTYVKLNAESKMTFPVAFDNKNRPVSLQGEAYFDVAKDKNRPFSISLDELKVCVLGTSFNIKSYDADEEVAVSVRSGRVSVSINSTSLPAVILTRNEKLIFNKRTEKYRIVRQDVTPDYAWADGVLLFDHTPFSTVVQTLERCYDVEIQVKDKSLLETSLTGRHINENLVSALESICFAISAKYEIKGRIVVIRK